MGIYRSYEGRRMPRTAWPEGVNFKEVYLLVQNSTCENCGSRLYKGWNHERKIYTFDGSLLLKRQRAKCSNLACERSKTWAISQEEKLLTMPRCRIGWDVFCWIGFRRFKRHWSVSQIRDELLDSHNILLSDDSIEDYLQNYQNMVAARHQDLGRLADVYHGIDEVDLSIDGLQPEKGHETLYVVRDLRKNIVWFAEALVSSSNEEVRQLFKRAKLQCEKLGLTVRSWMTDKQSAFLSGIKKEFPDTIHRYCQNPFIRDLAKPMSEIDSKAKVQMRKKVRGLRTLEKGVLQLQREGVISEEESSIVLDYCTIVKGVLNDNKGGPENPSGLRMYKGLQEVYDSLEQNLMKKGEARIDVHLEKLQACIERGMHIYEKSKNKIQGLVKVVTEVGRLLSPKEGFSEKRQKRFHLLGLSLKKKSSKHKEMGKLMLSFEDGLFAGGEVLDLPIDNLDLERWFKKPKGHQRRITGRKHAGTTIVYEGPTLIHTLDAHLTLNKPLDATELLGFVDAQPPISQIEGLKRRKLMSQASSKKKGL